MSLRAGSVRRRAAQAESVPAGRRGAAIPVPVEPAEGETAGVSRSGGMHAPASPRGCIPPFRPLAGMTERFGGRFFGGQFAALAPAGEGKGVCRGRRSWHWTHTLFSEPAVHGRIYGVRPAQMIIRSFGPVSIMLRFLDPVKAVLASSGCFSPPLQWSLPGVFWQAPCSSCSLVRF